MRARNIAWLLVIVSLVALSAWASGSRPETVSPGHVGRVANVEAACPTFNWAAVDGARAYDLVVYDVVRGKGGRAAGHVNAELSQPVLRQEISGRALGWTPSLGNCLERGKTYAWAVRAVTGKSNVWSEPRLFRVAGSSVSRVEDALTVLREYVGAASGEEVAATESAAGGPEEGTDKPEARAPEAITAGTPVILTPFAVDGEGNVFGNFYGNGLNLSFVDATWLGGRDSTFYASGTHTHAPSEISVGTTVAITTPTRRGFCDGSSGTSSSCTAVCPLDPPPNGGTWYVISGGCATRSGTVPACSDSDLAVQVSEPNQNTAHVSGWDCQTACLDGTNNTAARGSVVCAVIYN